MKTVEELADEWLFGRFGESDFNEHNHYRTAMECFIAGHKAALETKEKAKEKQSDD